MFISIVLLALVTSVAWTAPPVSFHSSLYKENVSLELVFEGLGAIFGESGEVVG